VCWKPCSSCWSFHLLREEFLSAPIHSPLSGSPYRSFTVVRPTGPRQTHPRVSVQTTTQWKISAPPPLMPLLDGRRARHDAPPEARFARTAIHSVVLFAMPLHVARTVRHACKLLPPWPIKWGAVTWSQGKERYSAHTHTHALPAFTTVLVLASIKNLWDQEARPPLCLACSPLCKHYSATQYSAPSTPLLDVRPRPEPG
jgi:hypothetical protein